MRAVQGTRNMALNDEDLSRFDTRRAIAVAAIGAFSFIVYSLLPADMPEPARRAVGIFVLAAILWATEAIPLYATSLCVIGLQILLLAEKGGLASGGGLSYADFLAPFGSNVIILFMGGFLLSAAVVKHGIDRAIAARLLQPFLRKPLSLIYAVMLIAGFLSMWMSNTATAAMMLAVIAPLIADSEMEDRYKGGLVLAVAFGANIGGIATPIGTPPNAVALAALSKAGIHISFVQWMAMTLPIAISLIAAAGAVLYFFHKPRAALNASPILPPDKIGLRGRITVAVLLCAIAAWVTSPWHRVDDAVIALIAAALLTGFRALDRRDVDRIEWDVLLLMWGGLSLGVAMEKTHLLEYVLQSPLFDQHGEVLATVIILAGVTVSTFMSNTAAANLLIPLAMAVSVAEQAKMAMLVALAVSFAMALPISTPPNAIAFASGKVTTAAMLRAGGIIGAIGGATLFLGYEFFLDLVLK